MFRSVRFFARLSSRCSAINVRRQFGFSVRSFSAVNKVDLDSALDELILEYDGKKNNVAKEEDIVDLVNLLHGSNTVGSSFDGAHTAELVRKVSAKASGIHSVRVFLDALEALPSNLTDREVMVPFGEALKSLLDSMGTSEVVYVFRSFTSHKFRDPDILNSMGEHIIRLKQDLTIDQIKGLALALQYLYFTHSRLLKYMGMGFLKQLKPNTPLAQVSLICYAFANLKVNNPAFWLAVSEWINKNLDIANEHPKDILQMVCSCALMNVPRRLIEEPIKFVIKQLEEDPRVKSSPSKWLTLTHSLALLQALSNYEANKVLQKQFSLDLVSQLKAIYNSNEQSQKILTMRAYIRLLQIASHCRYELKIEPKEVPAEIANFVEENAGVIEHVRYGNYAGKVNEDFRQNFYISAPPETHSTKPGLHVKTGTFVESFVWVCPERRVILPTSIGEKTPNAERVAILLGTYNLLTSIDAGDDLASEEFTRTRPLGELKMNLRHLRAAGFKPVLIDYYDLVAFPTNTQKILFIKERIVEPFKESNEDWC